MKTLHCSPITSVSRRSRVSSSSRLSSAVAVSLPPSSSSRLTRLCGVVFLGSLARLSDIGLPLEQRMAPNNGKEAVNWSRVMDDALIDAFMTEYNEGRKLGGSFSTQAYDNIVKYPSALFGKHIDKDKVKNWWKTLKKNFSDLHDIFKHVSGFAWNPATQMWDAEPEVWDALIEAKPKAALWRNTLIPNYEKVMLLYGVDRANGDEGETMRGWRKRHRSTTEVTERIHEIDNLVSQDDFSLNNADIFVEVDGSSGSLIKSGM